MTEKVMPKGFKIKHGIDRIFMLGMAAVSIGFSVFLVTSVL